MQRKDEDLVSIFRIAKRFSGDFREQTHLSLHSAFKVPKTTPDLKGPSVRYIPSEICCGFVVSPK